MPDFASKQRFDRKRRVQRARREPVKLSPISIAKTQSNKQSPLTVLSNLAKDFKNGVSALQRMTYNKIAAGEQKIVRFDTRSSLNRSDITSYTRSAMSVPALNTGSAKSSIFSSKLSSKLGLPPSNSASPTKHIEAAVPVSNAVTSTQAVKFIPHSTLQQKPGTDAPHVQLDRPKTFSAGLNAAPVTVHSQLAQPKTFLSGLNTASFATRTHRALTRPIRQQSGVSEAKMGSAFAFRKQGLVTSADREAARSVSEQYVGDFHQLPAAARVAQVLQADELIRNGLGKEQPVIRALAQAAREGKKRFVADVNPSYLQRAFCEAFGGASKAEQVLSTPIVHELAERYRFAVESIQRRVNGIQVAARAGNVVAPKSFATCLAPSTYGRGRVIEDSQSYSPPRLTSSSALSSNYTASNPKRIQAYELRAQLTNNDFAHLPLAGEHAVDEAKLNAKKLSSHSQREARVTEPRLTDRRISTMPADSTRSMSMPAMTSQISRAPTSSTQLKDSAKPTNTRFTGELRMIDATGRNLGRAELDMRG
jgi:hypothetical protein